LDASYYKATDGCYISENALLANNIAKSGVRLKSINKVSDSISELSNNFYRFITEKQDEVQRLNTKLQNGYNEAKQLLKEFVDK
jgi:uncharacterized protein YgiM (DUF1202 family)